MNRDVCEHFNPIDLPCDKCKPEALRLADALEMSSNHGMRREAAAELRRLHNLAMELQGKIYALEMARSMEQKTAKLKREVKT